MVNSVLFCSHYCTTAELCKMLPQKLLAYQWEIMVKIVKTLYRQVLVIYSIRPKLLKREEKEI